MKVNRIVNRHCITPPIIQTESQNNTFNGIYIPNTKEQPKFMYNTVLDTMREFKIGGTINKYGIDLPNITQKIKNKLNELKIIFIDK